MKNNNSAMNIRLPQKDKVEFENYCYDKGLKPSDVLRALINQVLAGENNKWEENIRRGW